MLASVIAFAAYAPAPEAADWSVKTLKFSALSIGVAFQDETTGWSSFTNGAASIAITKTTDGGTTWNPVKKQTNALMIMGNDVSTTPSLNVVTTGMDATSYSSDGDTFVGSKGSPFISQSIRNYDGGRVVSAAGEGVCLSSDSGATFKCIAVPFKFGPNGRYAAWPSPDVIYVTAGMWPSASAAPAHTRGLTANLRVARHDFGAVAGGGSLVSLEQGVLAPLANNANNASGYTGELWKSSDGGKTWKSLVSDEGNFYFNEIDCFDETTCVAVAEGFGRDGSASPGARVFTSADGESFKVSHHDTTDGTSLMAAKALSKSEHHVGGLLSGGVGLHTVDGGATYTEAGAKVKGQMITSLSFPTPTHGFATAVNNLQICSLLEYK